MRQESLSSGDLEVLPPSVQLRKRDTLGSSQHILLLVSNLTGLLDPSCKMDLGEVGVSALPILHAFTLASHTLELPPRTFL